MIILYHIFSSDVDNGADLKEYNEDPDKTFLKMPIRIRSLSIRVDPARIFLLGKCRYIFLNASYLLILNNVRLNLKVIVNKTRPTGYFFLYLVMPEPGP